MSSKAFSLISQSVQQNPTRSTILSAGLGASLVSAGVAWCINDYRKFLSLGRGGVPYNIFGWALITFLVRPFALGAQYSVWTGDYPPEGAHDDILALPVREGPRPQLGGIVPHRQLSQHPGSSMKQFVQNLFDNAITLHPELLEAKLSLYERQSPALFVHSNLLLPENSHQNGQPQPPEVTFISRGEIGHPHPDISVHMYVSPADARVLIDKCWAERHRLARKIPFFPGYQRMLHLGSTYLLIYGPRDEAEMEVLAVILQSSIRFMTGVEHIKPIEWRDKL